MGSLTKKAAIVGVALSDCGRVPDKTPFELIAQAIKRALDDAGLEKRDIDAIFNEYIPTVAGAMYLGDYLQMQPTFIDTTDCGGSSFEMYVQHATAAIAAGLCNTAVICYGDTPGSNRRAGLSDPMTVGGQPTDTRGDPRMPQFEFDVPFGMWMLAAHALGAQRHMYQYGTTSEQLAEIAVAMRKWASMNPLAIRRDPITVEDVINSPMLSSPLHLLDCCGVDDGGGAVIITSPERARNLRKPPVWVLGCGASYSHSSVAYVPDLTQLSVKQSGEAAFKMAGLTTKDIDVVELYSATTWVNLLQFEDLGFCRKGEGGPFVEGGRIAPGGELPANTDGGGLSFCHPGAYGIFLLIEAVRQLRGECGERQVPGAQIALCNGCGGQAGASGTVILGRD